MFIKPPRLRGGDLVAAVSMSRGLPAVFPHRYETGKRQLENTFGVKVIEAPNTLKEPDWLYRNPKARADDLHWALLNPEVRAIVSTIGGDDSVRILPYVHPEIIRENPKILMGFSDTTIMLSAFMRERIVSYYGPSIMCDLAENCGITKYVRQAVRRTLFEGDPFDLKPADRWTEERLEWSDPKLQNRRRNFVQGAGWKWLQGSTAVTGRLVGGCIDVLEFIKSTEWWPSQQFWKDAILFLDISGDVPSPKVVGRWLRNYGSQGILQKLSGILFARAIGYKSEMRAKLHAEIVGILGEFERQDMPVVADLDFGHTSPQSLLPIGCRASIDPSAQRIRVIERTVS